MSHKFLVALNALIFNFFIVSNVRADDPPVDESKPARVVGIVIDEGSSNPLEFANIALYTAADSTLVSGGITNERGRFELTGLEHGEYYLEANFIGFEKSEIDNIVIDGRNRTVDLGRIAIRPSTVEIGDVTVVADKPQVEFKLDKKVVNVSQVISAIGGTAVDVLENTPSVQVDIEGNVSVRGSSNFTVLIDGRPSVLDGSDALRQIPSSALESIEIITNPSAKYEPDGMAGIINLVTKKNSLNGFSGIVNGSVGTGDKYRGDIMLDYRTEKFKYMIGADWRDQTNFGSMSSRRETFANDTVSFLNIDGSRDFIRSGHNFKAGIEWYPSSKSTLSLLGEMGKSMSEREGNGQTINFTEPDYLSWQSITEESSRRVSDFYSLNLNFQHNFNNDGHKLEAMLYYAGEESSDIEAESEILADENFVPTNQYIERVFAEETEEEEEMRFKLDYAYPFSETGRVEAGLLSRIDKEIEGLTFEVFDEQTNTWEINEDYTSITDFRRDIHAAYATFSQGIGNFQFMAGLRGELTLRAIENTNRDEVSELNRFDMFPTFHSSYKIGENNELMASYSRRIRRPSGRDLDPNPNYMNRYTIRIGNPDLEPEYTDSYELGVLKRFGRSYLSLDGFHRITNNKIERFEVFEDDIFYLYSDNFNRDYATGAELTGNIFFTEWLLVNASTSLYNYRITGDVNGVSVDRKSTNWNGRLNTTLNFSDNSRMQINGFFRGPSVSAQGESKGSFYTNVSYRHEFFDKKLSATVSVRDPLGMAKYERRTFGPDFNSWFEWKREPRVFMLTLSYRINNYRSDSRGGEDGGNGGMDMGDGEF
ncbi:MAG TPA: TonB-dependent receptor [Mariniphaga sp.]|nr:TonB-dependent receptor [Mariniphaga sp.]